jgi:hypothetical protein
MLNVLDSGYAAVELRGRPLVRVLVQETHTFGLEDLLGHGIEPEKVQNRVDAFELPCGGLIAGVKIFVGNAHNGYAGVFEKL